MKKKNRFLIMKRRLEDAMFNNPVASANEATGMSNTPSDTYPEAKEKADLLDAPVSPPDWNKHNNK